MNFLDFFPQEHIIEVLKSIRNYSDTSEILLSTEKSNINENFTLLNVNSDGVREKYVLVKLSENLKIGEDQPIEGSKVLYPVYVIKNKNKEIYGAFANNEVKGYVLPTENDAGCIKIILESLAEHQALELAKRKEDKIEKASEYILKDVTDSVLSLDFFKDLEQAVIKETVEDLQLAINQLLVDPNLLVKNISGSLANNSLVDKDKKKSIFLNTPSKKLLPPAFDALLIIFALSNEKFRQEYFENLIFHYFESLQKFLNKLESSIADKITRSYSEHQVKVLLPIVKITIIDSFLNLEKSQKFDDILSNIHYFLKYPIINQEDIYEVVRNKIQSSDYVLSNYTLKGLSEKNGHLGEYFHLDINIRTENKERELQLFAKFIQTKTEFQQNIIEKGPAKKEDFFYRTLIPLYTQHGLENLLDFAPNCYLSRINNLLVLDDLSRLGYLGLKPNVVLDYDGLRATVENFAKFHSCSIILEEILSKDSGKSVRLDEDYNEYFGEVTLIYDDINSLKLFYDQCLEAYYYIFDKFPEITKTLHLSSAEIRARIKESYLSLFSKVKKSDTIRNTITHGDTYVANMLFKFGEDRLVKEGILIDFQLLRYISPAYDLLFFIFINSTKETRDKYFTTLIDDYYHYFSGNLRKFNLDPEIVFPRKSFDCSIKFLKSAAIAQAFTYAQGMRLDPDFREELTGDQEKFEYYFNNHLIELVDLAWDSENYRNYFKGLIEDTVDLIRNDF